MGLFVLRAIAAAAIVPPWQGPDEPAHFVLSNLASTGEAESSVASADLEREVLRSMARHSWWQPYGATTPDPLPQSFAEVPEHLATGTLMHPTYYWGAGAVLRLAGGTGIESDYSLLRAVSIVLSALTLVCGWAGTRILFGTGIASGVLAVAALHPQFVLSAISVNPDVLINLCGAAIWWQSARLLRGELHGMTVITAAFAVIVLAFIGAMAKRNGIPLVFIVICVLGFAIVRGWKNAPGNRRVLGLGAVFAALGLAVALAWIWLDQALLTFWSYAFAVRRELNGLAAASVVEFLRAAIDSSWLVAGWLRLPAPEPWLWIARGITFAGMAGAVAVLRSGRGSREAVLLAWFFVVSQVVPVLFATFISGAVPQGRYWFATLIPAVALGWIGLQQWFPPSARPYAAPGIVLGMALLDGTGFLLVLLPGYVPQ